VPRIRMSLVHLGESRRDDCVGLPSWSVSDACSDRSRSWVRHRALKVSGTGWSAANELDLTASTPADSLLRAAILRVG
jgi:hypothetical protein